MNFGMLYKSIEPHTSLVPRPFRKGLGTRLHTSHTQVLHPISYELHLLLTNFSDFGSFELPIKTTKSWEWGGCNSTKIELIKIVIITLLLATSIESHQNSQISSHQEIYLQHWCLLVYSHTIHVTWEELCKSQMSPTMALIGCECIVSCKIVQLTTVSKYYAKVSVEYVPCSLCH